MPSSDNRADLIEWLPFPGREGEGDVPLKVAAYPVTVAAFAEFIHAGGYDTAALWSARGWAWRVSHGITQPLYWGESGYDRERLPVTGVSFWESEAFANFVGGRLPNENEWQWVASNGGRTRYPWGEQWPSDPRNTANLAFFGAFGPSRRVDVDTYPLGRSRGGVWDLLGNVSEWCLPDGTSTLVDDSETAVLRGGCVWHTWVNTDAFSRDVVHLNTRDNQTGIRVVHGAPIALPSLDGECAIAWSESSHPLPEVRRPTAPFRQEGIPSRLTEETWRLAITGEVRKPCVLSLDDLKTKFPTVTRSGSFYCVCRWMDRNSVRGVTLRDILEYVQPSKALDQLFILQRSVPGPDGRSYDSCLCAVEAVRDDTIICYEMDGKPLSLELGWPARLINFQLLGYKQVKCLAELKLTTVFQLGWWEKEAGYDPKGVIQAGMYLRVGSKACRVDYSP